MSNHVSHAALPYPIKNARFSLLFPYLDADGDPTAPTTPDTEISKDNGAAADCAEEVSATSGMDGMSLLTLSGAETDCSALALNGKVASGPKATLAILYPRVLALIGSGTLSAGSAGGGTLGTILAYDVTGCFIRTTGGTGGGGTGGANNQARKIATYTPSTGAFTVVPDWETTPSTDTTYDILLPEGVTLGMLQTMNPATPGRKPVVDANGLIDANAVKVGPTGSGTAQTAKDLGALNVTGVNTLAGHDPGSTLAASSEITAMRVNTRANLSVPIEIETPDASTQVYKIRLFLFDIDGNMEAPDSTPTIALVNAAGTDRSSRLSVASNPSTGVYSWDYTATAGDAEEQLNWTFTVVEGGLTRTYPATTYVVEETAYRFSSSDRAALLDIPNTSEFEARTLPAANYGTAVGQSSINSNVVMLASDYLQPLLDGLMPISGTLGATGNDTTHLHLSGVGGIDSQLVDMLVMVMDVSNGNSRAVRWISNWANTGDLATLDEALPFTPQASADRYWVLPIRRVVKVSEHTTAAKEEIQSEVAEELTARGITANLFSGITKLAAWLKRMTRKDAGDADMVTAAAEIAAGGTPTYDELTDNLEAIRNASGGGGGGTLEGNWRFETDRGTKDVQITSLD